MTPAQVLLAAADVIDARGHAVGGWEDPATGAVCAIGAVRAAVGEDPRAGVEGLTGAALAAVMTLGGSVLAAAGLAPRRTMQTVRLVIECSDQMTADRCSAFMRRAAASGSEA